MYAPTPIHRQSKVAVLMGGLSSEHDISLKSGKAVAAGLRRGGWDVVEIDVGSDLPERLREERVQVAWVALHGRFGEDGCVQGLLELLRIPYTGSGPLASAMSMDKIVTKQMLRGWGLNLAPHRVLFMGESLPEVPRFPLVVKTPAGGSSIGTFICHDEACMKRALDQCWELDDRVLLEDYIAGAEITVALLDGEPLPVVGIVPSNAFFDLEAKYTKGKTRYQVPADIPPQVAEATRNQAATVARVLDLSGIARADFILDSAGVPWFLEVNTIPGMTETSLSPMAAAEAGVSFDQLVERVLQGARLHIPVGFHR